MTLPNILCIDPGTARIGMCVIDPNIGKNGRVVKTWRPDKTSLTDVITALEVAKTGGWLVALERASAQGPTRPEVVDTAHMAGHIEGWCKAAGGRVIMLRRYEVKQHLDVNGGDSAVSARAAEIKADTADKNADKGKKKSPGPCFGLVGDAWQAAACGLAAMFIMRREGR